MEAIRYLSVAARGSGSEGLLWQRRQAAAAECRVHVHEVHVHRHRHRRNYFFFK